MTTETKIMLYAGELRFLNETHKQFFWDMCGRCRWLDTYHESVFYLLGLTSETIEHLDSIFDVREDTPRFECMEEGWQTGSTLRLCALAFNLWNGHVADRVPELYTPYYLFQTVLAPYFMTAIQIRYATEFFPNVHERMLFGDLREDAK